jgi:hypothetical protein
MTPRVREHPRASLLHVAQIRVDGRFETVRVIDISETGIRLEVDLRHASLRIYEIFWVPVSGVAPLKLEADRVWSSGTIVGLRLRNPSPKLQRILRSFVNFHRQDEDPTKRAAG